MPRTPRSTSTPEKKEPLSPAKRRANIAILTVGVLIAAGAAAYTVQEQSLVTQNRQTAEAYTPAVSYVPPPDATEVAFLGDSFTAGTKASNNEQRWTSLLAQENSWSELNYGKGGTNYGSESTANSGSSYAERVVDIVRSNPDVVIVSTAGNRLDLDQVPGIESTFEDLREGLPDAKIVATSPYYRASEFPPEFEDFAAAIEREVEAVDGEYLEIGHPLLGKPELVSDDGVHPNDAGYREIADVIGGALDDAGIGESA